jgi:hypothetical protein
MHTLLLLPSLYRHSVKTRQQIVLLQEIIIQFQHRLIDSEFIEHSALICQRIHSPRAIPLERISSTLRSGAGCLERFEAVEFGERGGNEGWWEERGQDHVAVEQDVVD